MCILFSEVSKNLNGDYNTADDELLIEVCIGILEVF